LGSKDPFDKKYLIRGDEEDKIRMILDKDIQDKIMSIKDFSMRVEYDGAYIEGPHNALNFDYVRFKSSIDVTIDIIEKIEKLEGLEKPERLEKPEGLEKLEEEIPYGIPVSDEKVETKKKKSSELKGTGPFK